MGFVSSKTVITLEHVRVRVGTDADSGEEVCELVIYLDESQKKLVAGQKSLRKLALELGAVSNVLLSLSEPVSVPVSA